MISIAMATYNGEKYLKEQIDSILNQTYRDFELVICDDCSLDSTKSILAEYSKKDQRVKVVYNEYNLGFKKNFEKAVGLTTGDYIAFSDQDDIWENNHLEVLVSALKDYDVSCANALYVDADNNSLNRTFRDAVGLAVLPEPRKCFLRIFFNSNFVQGASMLMKSGFAKSLLPIPEGVPYHDCWFAMNASLNNGVVFTDEIVTRYRQHGNNVTLNVDRFGKIKKLLTLVFSNNGFPVDRFEYFNSLKLFHDFDSSEELRFVSYFMDERKKKKFSRRSKRFFKENYNEIMSTSSRKNYFKQFLKWKNWTPKNT